MSSKFASLGDLAAPPARTNSKDAPKYPEIPVPAGAKKAADFVGQPKQKPRAGGKVAEVTGKHRNPDFQKTTLYIPKETRKAVTIKIATEGEGMELSVLVTRLLDSWAAGRLDA